MCLVTALLCLVTALLCLVTALLCLVVAVPCCCCALTGCGSEWTVERRYSEFDALKLQLCLSTPGLVIPAFPKKHLFSK